jgi:hypothetical protein
VVIGVGIAFYVVAVNYERTRIRLQKHGVRVNAVIVSLHEGEFLWWAGSEDTVPVTYRYTHQGRTYEHSENVYEGSFTFREKGGSIPILYDPRDPSVSMVDDPHDPPDQAGVISGTIVTIPAAGLVMVVVWWFKIFVPQRRLLREGQLLPGEVVECSTSTEDGGGVVVKYGFATPDGSLIEGKEEAPRGLKGGLVAAGTRVLVYWTPRGVHSLL